MTDTATALRPSGRGSVGSVLRALGDSPWSPSLVLVVALLVLWEVAALTFLADSKAFPPVTDVVGDVVGDLDVYMRNARTTLREAWPGWFWGNVIATALGALAVALPLLERPVLHVAVALVLYGLTRRILALACPNAHRRHVMLAAGVAAPAPRAPHRPA